ncbi:unnamed protein product [Citrullus colocynthis]|uniref:Uncharacterized protein n=1 Tax=Citrullus colocynthis TaxID=252529 RepID=A0ABP0XV31_9ROSI
MGQIKVGASVMVLEGFVWLRDVVQCVVLVNFVGVIFAWLQFESKLGSLGGHSFPWCHCHQIPFMPNCCRMLKLELEFCLRTKKEDVEQALFAKNNISHYAAPRAWFLNVK